MAQAPRRLLLPFLIGLLVASCSGYGSGASPTPSATVVAMATGTGRAPVTPGTIASRAAVATSRAPEGTPGASPQPSIVLNPRQIQVVTTMQTIISAYNAGQLDVILALVSEDVRWADCDYGQQPPVARMIDGRPALAQWLGQRFAEHDQLEVGQIILGGQDGFGMGLSIARRTSDGLRGLGFANGITPEVSAKVIFDYNPGSPTGRPRTGTPRGLLTIFGNASDGAQAQSSCRPVAAS